MTQDIFQTLFKTAEQFQELGNSKGKHRTGRNSRSRLPSVTMVRKTVESGDLSQIKQMVEEHPKIVLTGYWKNSMTRTAIRANQLESKYQK